jgi:hypothetical protein
LGHPAPCAVAGQRSEPLFCSCHDFDEAPKVVIRPVAEWDLPEVFGRQVSVCPHDAATSLDFDHPCVVMVTEIEVSVLLKELLDIAPEMRECHRLDAVPVVQYDGPSAGGQADGARDEAVLVDRGQCELEPVAGLRPEGEREFLLRHMSSVRTSGSAARRLPDRWSRVGHERLETGRHAGG